MATELLLPRGKVPDPHLRSYVKLDMAFGVGAGPELGDKTRYRSHGAIITATWADGLHGRGLDFDPTGPDYVEIPLTHTQLDFTTEDFSGVVRLKVDDLTSNRNIFTRGWMNTDGYFWFIDTTGASDFRTSQALFLQRTATLGGEVVINTWYTLGFSRNGVSVRLYKNGVDVTSIVGVHVDPASCARNATIGIWQDLLTDPFDGMIEFLRIFGGVALSASEHLAWHRALA